MKATKRQGPYAPIVITPIKIETIQVICIGDNPLAARVATGVLSDNPGPYRVAFGHRVCQPSLTTLTPKPAGLSDNEYYGKLKKRRYTLKELKRKLRNGKATR